LGRVDVADIRYRFTVWQDVGMAKMLKH